MVSYLTLFFPRYVDVNFTAKVEEQLDEVSGNIVKSCPVSGGPMCYVASSAAAVEYMPGHGCREQT
jgi:hypothetical protein